jgi:hypothetical protein
MLRRSGMLKVFSNLPNSCGVDTNQEFEVITEDVQKYYCACDIFLMKGLQRHLKIVEYKITQKVISILRDFILFVFAWVKR